MGARSIARSVRPGLSAAVLAPATSLSAPPRRGCARCWTKRALECCPGWCGRACPSQTRVGEYLRYVEHDLDRKPSTLTDYRSVIRAHLLPAFGSLRLEDVTADRIEAWKGTLRMSNRTKVKLLTVLNGIMARARRVHRLPVNPMADVEKPRHRRSTAIEVFSPEEVHGARPGGGLRAGRSDLPHRGVHRASARRARGASLARRRLRRAADSRVRLVRWRPSDDAEEREGPIGPARACRRGDARATGPARALLLERTISSSPANAGGTSMRRRCRGDTRRL